ncbi:hypothetical protein [Acerihabitans arboris]|uniref:hypothetical protein n=1 Tax=Acerihabitans arboris TaxID=2691583 RepID=UPI0015B57E94|nr:hypothetical protein [Acerihabitans arboris]
MFDNAALSLEEIVVHCRALSYAIIEISHPGIKELLLYILSERLELLNKTLEMDVVEK